MCHRTGWPAPAKRGPLGFEEAQHRQTLRPSVDGVRSRVVELVRLRLQRGGALHCTTKSLGRTLYSKSRSHDTRSHTGHSDVDVKYLTSAHRLLFVCDVKTTSTHSGRTACWCRRIGWPAPAKRGGASERERSSLTIYWSEST